jgi:hypothetical protein
MLDREQGVLLYPECYYMPTSLQSPAVPLAAQGISAAKIKGLKTLHNGKTEKDRQEAQDPFSFSAPRFTGPRRHARKLYIKRHHSVILST